MIHPLPPFPENLKHRCREAVLLAAQWHQNNQVRHAWPHWTADAGRFASTVNIQDPTERPLQSICWSTARGAQALLSAYRLSGDEAFLDTARKAMAYVESCQIFAPEYAHHAGACGEETAQSDHIASRDTVEAVQGFANLYAVTKEPVALRRAQAGADWLTGWFLEHGYPHGYIWHKTQGDKLSACNEFSRFMLAPAALTFAQLDALAGEERYARFIAPYLDWVVESVLEADGAFKLHDGTDVMHHVENSGPVAGCLTNDDGVGVALIAAWRATGRETYREAALRNGEWWLRLDSLPSTYAAIPAALNFLLDLYRLAGDERYLRKAASYIEKTIERLVLLPADKRLHGGFRGHDLSSERERNIHTSSSGLDYVSQRTMMYTMMALAKAACTREEEWNLAYSGFGF